MTGNAGKRYRVHCGGDDCTWTGVRTATECECYEDWAMYCRPTSPGPGCPSGVMWPCPQCDTTPLWAAPVRPRISAVGEP